MKKILIIIMFVLAIVLIGTGIFFGLSDDSGNNTEEIVDVLEEIKKDENILTENVNVYRTIEDAIYYLKNLYLTEDVTVTSNDEVKATIVVLSGTENEVSYSYFKGAGDLIINQ